MSEQRVCLDLFAGLGGFSQAFADADDWRVVTVDIDPSFDPDIEADVLTLGPTDLPDPDVVLASPECKGFSVAAIGHHWTDDGRPATTTAAHGVLLVYHTIGLIRALDPDWWVLENPRGMLRNLIGDPEGTIWWCQYGADVAKPTDLWGDHPPSFDYRKCANDAPDCDHQSAPRGSKTGTQGRDTAAERAKIPRGLSAAVLEAVEQPASEQTTFPLSGETDA